MDITVTEMMVMAEEMVGTTLMEEVMVIMVVMEAMDMEVEVRLDHSHTMDTNFLCACNSYSLI